jgi:hypothetical protein
VETANRIIEMAMNFQNKTSVDIDEGELRSFYSTLDKIYSSLSQLALDEAVQSDCESLCRKNQIENKKAAQATAGGNI